MEIPEIKRRLLEDLEKLRSPQGYLNAGYPRYHTLFGRDSLISAWQMLRVDPAIAKATLQMLANHQGTEVNPRAEEEPGKILHEFSLDPQRSDVELAHWDFPYYGSIDSTPLFIVVARAYYQTTQDYSFLRSIWSNILAAYRWITVSGDGDGDGYVEYLRMNPWGLFHQGWKDSVEDHLGIEPPVAMVEAQGYTYAAFQNLIFLEKALGENNVADKLAVRSEALKTRFNEDYWMRRESCFALALDGDKRQKAVVTSNPGHLLFTGIVASDKVKPLVSRLFQADLWTSYGIRTHSDREPDYDPYSYHKGSVWPHDNWIICKGLLNLGFTFQADRIKAALLKAFKELGGIPELYAVVDDRIIDLHEAEHVYANPLQAWSTAALLEMIWTD